MIPAPGPGTRPDGVPAAVALSPILSARYSAHHLDQIAVAAPGARVVGLSPEGLADGDISDVEVLLRGPLPAAAFDRVVARCPRLKWVHSATAGVERVLTPAALERGLTITNARGVFSRPIADYVMLMVLAVSRRLPQLLELQRERTWQPLEALDLRDVTLGIVGYGSIGRAVAELAAPFGCRLIATRRRGGDVSGDGDGESANGPPLAVEMRAADELPAVLGESDFVVLALPLTAETENLFDAQMLSAVKRGAWLVNVARGRLIDEAALVRALRDGPLGGAVLDTFREEPVPADSPLYDLANVILTPHTAWCTRRVLDASIELFCENLRRYRRGEPLRNVVDPERGY